ncbi:unnamed protein product [Cyprideis torosa]|uniref:Mesencephalic astrocyte-derived neurotrophic factor homolog n=1 Tax=Cyprideis torosa TaxID=163714 RepID=A0A7R8WMJ8_9CRUS|nr:unnamed protein product [Cyprideis torosa]CAG0899429.1 unnamed protein product [Cyprideis torosa]
MQREKASWSSLMERREKEHDGRVSSADGVYFDSVRSVSRAKRICFNVVDVFRQTLSEDDTKNFKTIEDRFRVWCKGAKGKENRFCYYVGGLEESATGILNELSKPLTNAFPTEKICEKLKKKDAQICDLRYEKQIDLETVDLKKLKVRDLRKILSGWDETCDGCIEKDEYIRKIESLMPKYAPKAEL